MPLIALLLFTVSSFAQSDTIHVTLKAKHFGFMTAGTRQNGQIDADLTKVFNQVAAQLELKDSIGRKWVKDTAQLITVVAKGSVIPQLFRSQGSLKESLATNYNNEMRDMLLPQLQRKPELLQKLYAIMQQNWQDTWLLVLDGFSYLITIKE